MTPASTLINCRSSSFAGSRNTGPLGIILKYVSKPFYSFYPAAVSTPPVNQFYELT
jgi:hypothetical protein